MNERNLMLMRTFMDEVGDLLIELFGCCVDEEVSAVDDMAELAGEAFDVD